MVESLSNLTLLSIIVEIVTNVVKSILPAEFKPRYSKIIALVVGMAIGMITKAGIVGLLGFPIPPVIDYLITGIVISKGSNAFHDFSSMLRRNAK